ncbi:MAG: hypothetical protein F4237_09745 [Gemmatimonadetes bacterium]|nr:hypothetical protein [Gemmatimonadota bacterium]MYE70316.1 hypothetical protein [Gemmatimonadota bacterium]
MGPVSIGATGPDECGSHRAGPSRCGAPSGILPEAEMATRDQAAAVKLNGGGQIYSRVASGPTRRRRTAVLAKVLLFTVLAGACENPLAPESCGPIPQQTVHVGESASVPMCFNDENGDGVSLSASSSDPVVATAEARGSAVTVTAVSPGTATVTVTATDPGGLSGTVSFSVMVPNRAPQAADTISARTVEVGKTASVDLSASFEEPDGQPLSYHASSSDETIATVSVSGSTVTAAAVSVGTATVTVTARDPEGLEATQSFDVTVTAPGTPDLYFSDVDPATIRAVPGAGITVNFTIRNAGSAPSPPAVSRVHQSNDGTIDPADPAISEHIRIEALAPLATTTILRRFSFSNRALPGTVVFIGMCIDAVTGEQDTENNCSDAVRITITTTGYGIVRLTDNSVADGSPAWSPDGAQIAFESNRDINFEIYVMNADGSGVARRTNSANDDDFSPAWSPDGRRIAFSSRSVLPSSPRFILAMDADGTGPTRLNDLGDAHNPAWSPDGRRIAFQLAPHMTSDDDAEVYLMNADGSGVSQRTDNADNDYAPTWAPDSYRIAFVSDRGGDPDIYVMSLQGTGPTNLTDNDENDSAPAWSPDGHRIAFVSDRDGDRDIYVMLADGTEVINLTVNADDDSAPAWSPDGTRIAFVSDRDGNPEIYVMNVPVFRSVAASRQDLTGRTRRLTIFLPGPESNRR